jgi:spore germination cell wall hydrolase CwlJ-like protein
MYHEARSEGVAGEKAVAEVILQRVRSRYYPNSICDVVYEGTDRGDNLCQFSYACDSYSDQPIEPNAWARSRQLASRIMAGTVVLLGQTDRATNYHTVAVLPDWAEGMVRTRQIGNHVFYRHAPLVRAKAETDERRVLQSGVLLSDGTIVPYDPTRISASSLEIKTKIEINGAMGDGS